MLLKETEQLQLIFNSMPQFVWIKDLSGRYVLVNKKFSDFGLSHGISIIGKTDFEIFPEETARLCQEADQTAIRQREPQYTDYCYPGQDGMSWFETYVTPIFDDNNNVSGTIGISRKISRCKHLEGELKKQKELLKILIDTIPDFIFYKDHNSVYLGCNKMFAEKFARISEKELIGKTDFDFMENKELAKSIYRKDQELFASGTSEKHEEKFVSADGRLIDVETITAPFYYDGEIAGLIGISRNITARKKLEEELRAQKEYAELLLDIVPSAVFSVDLQGNITSWNKQAEVLTGYTRSEVIGKNANYFVPGQYAKSVWLLSNLEEHSSKITTLITKEGNCRHVIKSEAVIKDNTGKITGKLESLHDVSKMVTIEAALRESQERYAAIVNNAPQIVMIHHGGIIRFINKAGINALNYNKEDVLGKNLCDFLTPKSADIIRKVLSAKSNQSLEAYEVDFVKQSGEIIHVLAKATSVIYEGRSARLVVFIDMTAKKQAEKQLHETERKLRLISGSINEIFVIRGRDKFEYVTSAFEEIIGYPFEDMNGDFRRFLSYIHPEDKAIMKEIFVRGGEDMDKGLEQEFRIVRPDGEIRWLWVRSYPINNLESEEKQKAVTFSDITDRKLMENALRERELETQRELNLAARVQQDWLPKFYLGEKVKVDKIFMPHQTVSGDLLNYKWFPETEKLCGYVVDVSGHGMATALQTATFKMFLDKRLLEGDKIDDNVFQNINQNIMPYLSEDSFAGLIYFEFDFTKELLTVIAGGITLFLAADHNGCMLKEVSGCYLGIFDKADAGTFTVPFKPGDVYCFMSDGLSDLIEQCGVKRQKGFIEYKTWLERLAKSPERQDDCAAICIGILRENRRINVLTIQGERELEQAQRVMIEFLEQNSGDSVCMLDVALNEAINNGLRAGGRVRIKMQKVGRRIIIRVKDYGKGFDALPMMEKLNKITDAELDEEFETRLLEESGRGILIMKMFCNKIVYNKRGNEVLLMKFV